MSDTYLLELRRSNRAIHRSRSDAFQKVATAGGGMCPSCSGSKTNTVMACPGFKQVTFPCISCEGEGTLTGERALMLARDLDAFLQRTYRADLDGAGP